MEDEDRSAPCWLDRALFDPASVFANPEAVVDHPDLSMQQKVAVLRSWQYDAAEVEVAEEEGMRGPGSDLLQRIILALARLNHGRDVEFVTVSKQHGLM